LGKITTIVSGSSGVFCWKTPKTIFVEKENGKTSESSGMGSLGICGENVWGKKNRKRNLARKLGKSSGTAENWAHKYFSWNIRTNFFFKLDNCLDNFLWSLNGEILGNIPGVLSLGDFCDLFLGSLFGFSECKRLFGFSRGAHSQ
jgi:hypothetical protein